MFLEPRDIGDLISIVAFTFVMQRHLIRLASRPFISFHLAKFGWVAFADLRVQRLTAKQNTKSRRVRENSDPILSLLWTKVHEILGHGLIVTSLPKVIWEDGRIAAVSHTGQGCGQHA